MKKTVKTTYSLDIHGIVSLAIVIKVIRAGLEHLVSEHKLKYSDAIYVQLDQWCRSTEKELMNVEK